MPGRHRGPIYRLFTKESMTKISNQIQVDKAAKEEKARLQAQQIEQGLEPEQQGDDEKPRPDPRLEQGMELPKKYANFPPDLFGKPIEDLDPYYNNKYTFMVIAKDRNICRFSATSALYLLSPFNPLRRIAIYLLTHPLFSLTVMLVIFVNCVFMAMNNEIHTIELTLTGIYTCESIIKILARGFFINDFTYLRDAWNWLDFFVVSLAYVTMLPFIDLGSVASLRTFRVFRALKTVAVVPGLKTIVGALMQAVKRLRDVGILSVFILSIFALIGLQLYPGHLRQKCVKKLPEYLEVLKLTEEEQMALWYRNQSNWDGSPPDYQLCGINEGAGQCQSGSICIKVGNNPNFGYTSFDTFPWALLCAFRLMTQDYWEDLYQKVLRAMGPIYIIFFLIVIFMGSFYLVNLILAIVAMSYDEQKKQDEEDVLNEDAEEEEYMAGMMRTPSESSGPAVEEQKDSSQEPTPYRDRRFSWRKPSYSPLLERRAMVLPFLDNLNLKYIDDSSLEPTPTTEEFRFLPSHQAAIPSHLLVKRAGSTGSRKSGTPFLDVYAPRNRRSLVILGSKASEPTHFQYIPTVRSRQTLALPEVLVRKGNGYGGEYEKDGKLFSGNPFISRTPSASKVDMKDIATIKELINASGGSYRHSIASDHQPKRTMKEIIKDLCWKAIFGWSCPEPWHKFAHVIEVVIMDAFVDLFITLCIVVNTIFMAMDHYGIDPVTLNVLQVGNKVFTTIFTAEAVLKIIALNPINYLKDNWNCFDILVVILSMVELGLENVKGLGILRSFRLLRVFKLARSWPTLNLLIGIVGRTIGALGNLCFVLAIIVFIFAVMGMQLFGKNYNEEKFPLGVPRWHFKDFLHSFMIVFRVLCGEWIESMWACMHCSGYHCIPFFLLTMVIANLVVLNLFLALLLSSFGSESLKQSQEENEVNKLQEASDRINRFVLYIKARICIYFRVKIKKKSIEDFDVINTQTDMVEFKPMYGSVRKDVYSDDAKQADGQTLVLQMLQEGIRSHAGGYMSVSQTGDHSEENEHEKKALMDKLDSPTANSMTGAVTCQPTSNFDHVAETRLYFRDDFSCSSSSLYSKAETASLPQALYEQEGPEVNEVNVVFIRYPDECLPKCCNLKPCRMFGETTIGQKLWLFRCYAYKLVEHKYFETFVILCILASSISLAIEDIYLPTKPVLYAILKYMDKIFTIIFAFEMLIKWAAYGFKKYFTDAWCWLDFIIVFISLVSLAAEGIGLGSMSAFRALRTLRALRPLRAVSRWEGMRVVVNALFQAIPAIFNVLLVCIVFWLIFSIMGVQLFGGMFYKCVGRENETKFTPEEVPNKTVCLALNQSWINSKINFDNVPSGYLALFQVATYKGWIDIMYDAIDSRGEVDLQPREEGRATFYLFFVIFIIFGAFFTLNLFIGVIIDNFNVQKRKAGGSLELFMTEDQRKYYKAMKKLGSKKPQKPIPKPKFKCQLFFFNLTTSQKFDIAIMVIILLNMGTMTLDHYDMSKTFENVLDYVNNVFVVIFTLECVMKLIAFRLHYFRQVWNVFDFLVVITSLLGLSMPAQTEKLFSPTLLRVVRVFRIGRVLRLVKSAKGIRTLLFSLMVSLPALFNIGLLLFLVMFIYSTFGMSFFMHVTHMYGINELFNFETFGRSFTLLFQMCTSAGWDSVLAGITNEDKCNATVTDEKPNGECGNRGMGIAFLVTYLLISFLVVVNMYIAVILENFSQATEDVQQGLTQDDFDMYYEVWEKFDEKATQFISLDVLSDFVDSLEEPLRIPKPNYYRLVALDIPICEDNKIYCVDILDALTRYFLQTSAEANELSDLKKRPANVPYNPISSTLRRQREIICARIIQRRWKNFVRIRKAQKAEMGLTGNHIILKIDEVDEENESTSKDKLYQDGTTWNNDTFSTQ